MPTVLRYEPPTARRRLPAWFERGDLPCTAVDPDSFYPDPGNSGRYGVDICRGDGRRPACPIAPACLGWALETRQGWGTWGGMTASGRATLSPADRAALIHEGLAHRRALHPNDPTMWGDNTPTEPEDHP